MDILNYATHVSRRRFIINGAMGTAGAVLTPSVVLSSPLPAAQWPVFGSLLRGLAKNVGYGLATNFLYDYVKGLIAEWQKAIYGQVNQSLNFGYTEPWRLQTPVYQYGQSSILYPVHHRRSPNGLGVFFDFNTCTCDAELAGPSLEALKAASSSLIDEEGYSVGQVKNALIPQKQSSTSYGLYQRSYKEPDSFVSRNGNVDIDYKSNGRGEGEARIVYKVDNLRGGKKTMLDQTYGIEYEA
jgi:hypothetical protein